MSWLSSAVKKAVSKTVDNVRGFTKDSADAAFTKEQQAKFKQNWVDAPRAALERAGGREAALMSFGTTGKKAEDNANIFDESVEFAMGDEGKALEAELDQMNYGEDTADPILQSQAPTYQGPQENDASRMYDIIAQRAAQRNRRTKGSYALGGSGSTTSQTLGGA